MQIIINLQIVQLYPIIMISCGPAVDHPLTVLAVVVPSLRLTMRVCYGSCWCIQDADYIVFWV